MKKIFAKRPALKSTGATASALPRLKNPAFMNVIKGRFKKDITAPLKVSARAFIDTRNKIGAIFATSNFGKGVYKKAIQANNLNTKKIPIEKVTGDYSPEYASLHKAVQDALKLAKRDDLAQDFSINVPVYTPQSHPIDYLATLLKGAGSKAGVKAQTNRYKAIVPLVGMMKETLVSQGKMPPKELGDLTQLFYNEVVAKKGSDYEPMNFDELTNGDSYHADESVVAAVVTFANSLKNRKKAGEQLPKIFDKIATGTMRVEQQLTEKAQQAVSDEVGAQVVGNSKYIIIGVVGAVILIIYLLAKKM